MRVTQSAVTRDFVHAISFNTAADTVTGQRLLYLVQLDKTIQAVASINHEQSHESAIFRNQDAHEETNGNFTTPLTNNCNDACTHACKRKQISSLDVVAEMADIKEDLRGVVIGQIQLHLYPHYVHQACTEALWTRYVLTPCYAVVCLRSLPIVRVKLVA